MFALCSVPFSKDDGGDARRLSVAKAAIKSRPERPGESRALSRPIEGRKFHFLQAGIAQDLLHAVDP